MFAAAFAAVLAAMFAPMFTPTRASYALSSTAVIFFLPWMALPADAAGNNTLTTSASVTGRCKVTAAPGMLDFGNIDPTGSSNAVASSTFSIKCTKGTTSTAASDDGGLYFSATRRMRHSVNTTSFLPYAISYIGDAGFTGHGFGAAALARSVTITGGITPSQFQNAFVTAAGQVYTDTVTITVNP